MSDLNVSRQFRQLTQRLYCRAIDAKLFQKSIQTYRELNVVAHRSDIIITAGNVEKTVMTVDGIGEVRAKKLKFFVDAVMKHGSIDPDLYAQNIVDKQLATEMMIVDKMIMRQRQDRDSGQSKQKPCAKKTQTSTRTNKVVKAAPQKMELLAGIDALFISMQRQLLATQTALKQEVESNDPLGELIVSERLKQIRDEFNTHLSGITFGTFNTTFQNDETHDQESSSSSSVSYVEFEDVRYPDLDFIATTSAVMAVPFPAHLCASDVVRLQAGAFLDYRHESCEQGKAYLMKVVSNDEESLRLHYVGWNARYDFDISIEDEVQNIFEAKSISRRGRHRLQNIGVGDMIWFNDPHIAGMRVAKVFETDARSGQIGVAYQPNADEAGVVEQAWCHSDEIGRIGIYDVNAEENAHCRVKNKPVMVKVGDHFEDAVIYHEHGIWQWIWFHPNTITDAHRITAKKQQLKPDAPHDFPSPNVSEVAGENSIADEQAMHVMHGEESVTLQQQPSVAGSVSENAKKRKHWESVFQQELEHFEFKLHAPAGKKQKI